MAADRQDADKMVVRHPPPEDPEVDLTRESPQVVPSSTNWSRGMCLSAQDAGVFELAAKPVRKGSAAPSQSSGTRPRALFRWLRRGSQQDTPESSAQPLQICLSVAATTLYVYKKSGAQYVVSLSLGSINLDDDETASGAAALPWQRLCLKITPGEYSDIEIMAGGDRSVAIVTYDGIVWASFPL